LESNIKKFTNLNENFFDQFIFGASIKSYEFNIYKTKKELNNYHLNIHGNLKLNFQKKNNKYSSLLEGLNFTKDLVSEPGNVLHPDEYVNRIKKLKSLD
jgi:leucyl aminopeptidase